MMENKEKALHPYLIPHVKRASPNVSIWHLLHHHWPVDSRVLSHFLTLFETLLSCVASSEFNYRQTLLLLQLSTSINNVIYFWIISPYWNSCWQSVRTINVTVAINQGWAINKSRALAEKQNGFCTVLCSHVKYSHILHQSADVCRVSQAHVTLTYSEAQFACTHLPKDLQG